MNDYLDAMAKPFMVITPWLPRVFLGMAFFIHGYGKFPLPPERMVTWFESLGYMYPEFVTSLVALGEVIAGVGVIVGGFFSNHIGNLTTRLSGGAIVVIMIGALVIAHADWFTDPKTLFTSEQIFLLILGLYYTIRGNN